MQKSNEVTLAQNELQGRTMANQTLFQSIQSRLRSTDRHNNAGGVAYATSSKHALAQYAATGCFNATFYTSAKEQLDEVVKLCKDVEPEFIAKTAVFARQRGRMKDMPSLLVAVLSVQSPGLMAEVFDRVIDNGRMLRNFVQIMRSGTVGRKSLGTLPKRLVLQWLEQRTDAELFAASVGSSPSLADIIKMTHPKPTCEPRQALFAYLLGRKYEKRQLPQTIRDLEQFKHNPTAKVPDVPFQMLTSLQLKPKHWKKIARNAGWQMTRMNLNTFHRHGVFEDREMIGVVANRLKSEKMIQKSRVFPYQLMVAHANANKDLPNQIVDALQDAMEIALKNVPVIEGRVFVFPDVSGSMHSPVTGHRPGSTTTVRCIDVAALIAAAILRKNRNAEVIPFESDVVSVRLNRRDSVLTNAKTLASLPCGGTNCSAPLKFLNRTKRKGDLIIYVSDNESWLDSTGYCGRGPTATVKAWRSFKNRCPRAKMICIDIQPNSHTQAKERPDIINVGGFSDQVFDLIADVSRGNAGMDHWVNTIESISI